MLSRQRDDPRELLDRLLRGDRAALARFLSALEAGDMGARALSCDLYRRAGRAHVVGISGPPGVGKSTLVGVLVRAWRDAGRTVAMLAVDPTSPRTGGALLGDRVRLPDLSGDAGVFVRSMASRGRVGGLAGSTVDLLLALDTFGFEVLILETVGAGQDEVDVARVADTTVVVTAPSLGDDLQASKAGLLETADVLVVNKADLPGADQTAADLLASLRLGESRAWDPPIVRTSARTGEGAADLLAALNAHRAYLQETGLDVERRHERSAYHLRTILEDRLRATLERASSTRAWSERAAAVAAGDRDPYETAEGLLRELLLHE